MLLRAERVRKSFGAVQAVKDVSFTIDYGEVLGLMGPNGAGKTTLFNLIMQEMVIDAGIIEFEGRSLKGLGPHQVTHMGIGRTYQIPQPFRKMTVLENVMVGGLFSGKGASVSESKKQAMDILDKVGLSHLSKGLTASLGLLELKRLELARALSTRPKLLLLDEIAGGLVDSEVSVLKDILKHLKQEGQSMLIIEHVLNLLFELSDRLVVVNFGESIAEAKPQEVIQDNKVIEAYLGSSDRNTKQVTVKENREHLGNASLSPLLSVNQVDVSYGEFQALYQVSMNVKPNEIVGLIGLNGSGKTTLIRAITKLLPIGKGSVQFKNNDLNKLKSHEIVEIGIAQSIEGRKIFPELTVLENLELGAYSTRTRSKKKEMLEKVFTLFPILFERRHQLGTTMSGGQQQMLAIGRALMAEPELLICDEISLGLAPLIIDQLYETLEEINRQGTAILLVEQSIERALSVVDRAYVIEGGKVVLSGTAQELSDHSEFRSMYFGVSV